MFQWWKLCCVQEDNDPAMTLKKNVITSTSSSTATATSSTASSTPPASAVPNSAALSSRVSIFNEAMPVWNENTKRPACTRCRAMFTGSSRKHHCRSCGHVFCRDCASSFDRILRLGFDKPVRVCVSCKDNVSRDNEFYRTTLPLLIRGELFVKHGKWKKRTVALQFDKSREVLQYQSEGKVKFIDLPSISNVKTLNGMTFEIITNHNTRHTFDATSDVIKQRWVQALQCIHLKYGQAVLAAHAAEMLMKKEAAERAIASRKDLQRQVEQDVRSQQSKSQRAKLRQKFKLEKRASSIGPSAA